MKKIIVMIFLLFSDLAIAKDNVSLSKILLKFQGGEYNMLLFPPDLVIEGKKRRTRKAINKGYMRALDELVRQIEMRGIALHIKSFNQNGSTLPQYRKQDKKSYKILKQMMTMQVKIREDIFDDEKQTKSNKNINKKVNANDINVNLDNVFDISNDKTDNIGEVLSPSEAFISGFVEMSELYNAQVLKLSDALHPFDIKGKPVMKHVHSVFGIAFFPYEIGRIKMMRMYIILAVINTEKNKSVQIIAKNIPSFEWDRNYLYISAATGKIIRQIVSSVIGEPFIFIR
jgi:hypothetical protein